MKQSIIAVAVGYGSATLASVLCSMFATSMVMSQPSTTPLPSELPTSLLVIRALCTIVFAVVGGWLTARLAPKAAMLHSVVTAAVFMMISLVTALFSAASASAEWVAQPSWYPFLTTLCGTAAMLFGGFLGDKTLPAQQGKDQEEGDAEIEQCR